MPVREGLFVAFELPFFQQPQDPGECFVCIETGGFLHAPTLGGEEVSD